MEKETEKLFYSIGEVADMFGVNTSLIRFWEKEFPQIKPRKNNRGERIFTKKDIEHFRSIYHLVKENGYTLEGAKTILKNKGEKVLSNAEIAEKLQKVRRFLLALKEEL